MTSTEESVGAIARVYGPGDRIDRYEVCGVLGRGGMAVVYAVRRRGVGGFERELALKMMLPHLVGDGSYLAMFLDEIRIASRIEHQNVVRVLDVGEHDGSPFMVMELLRGRTLASCLREAAPRAMIAAWIGQVAAGLHAAHETKDAAGNWLRIVHRDVSAANVHVGIDGRARVLDFGIAGAVGRATTTRHGELKGRLSMMAPESITRSAPLDRRADVWSLGVVAWQAFAGARLFAGENEAETLWRVVNADVPLLPDEVPEAVRVAVMACLHRDVAKRLSTAAEFASMLAEYASHEGVDEAAQSAWMRATFGESDPVPPTAGTSTALGARASEEASTHPERPQFPSSGDELTPPTGRHRHAAAVLASLMLVGAGATVWFAFAQPPAQSPAAGAHVVGSAPDPSSVHVASGESTGVASGRPGVGDATPIARDAGSAGSRDSDAGVPSRPSDRPVRVPGRHRVHPTSDSDQTRIPVRRPSDDPLLRSPYGGPR